MTARTLEEIEAISCGITYMSGHETYVCDPDGPCRKCLKRRVRAAVAIAQEQRAALQAIWPFVEEDDGGFATPQYQAAINQVRATLGVGTKR